jgi:hypothetical protein
MTYGAETFEDAVVEVGGNIDSSTNSSQERYSWRDNGTSLEVEILSEAMLIAYTRLDLKELREESAASMWPRRDAITQASGT